MHRTRLKPYLKRLQPSIASILSLHHPVVIHLLRIPMVGRWLTHRRFTHPPHYNWYGVDAIPPWLQNSMTFWQGLQRVIDVLQRIRMQDQVNVLSLKEKAFISYSGYSASLWFLSRDKWLCSVPQVLIESTLSRCEAHFRTNDLNKRSRPKTDIIPEAKACPRKLLPQLTQHVPCCRLM